jgi:hypothetical protein
MFLTARTLVTSLFPLCALFVAAPPAGGQVQWSRRAVVSSYAAPGLVYDSARQRVVMLTGPGFLGSEVWEWTGIDWTPVTLGGASSKVFFASAYDRSRQRLVRFGGSPVRSGDTWEWDGVQWLQRSSANEPPPRSHGAMVYDEARGRVLLFGGATNNYLNDTWEWDGNDWIQRSPANVPPARDDHSLAYDASRQRMVLFGGVGSTSFGDTWEWDGSDWIQMSPANAPSARSDHGLAYDRIRQQVVLFGGNPPGLACCNSETWEWDGNDWEQRFPATIPSPRYSHALAFDEVRGTVVLFGGEVGLNQLVPTSTWEWDGNDWRESPPAGPVARMYAAAAYDSARDRVVLFGGGVLRRDYTWEWDGDSWIERRPEVRPQARWVHDMAYDSRRGRVVLFGGEDNDNDPAFDDTWEWDGAEWVERQPIRKPPAQTGHVMAYDAARGRTVLLSALPNADPPTWEWDGTDWIPRSGLGPGFRNFGAMAYDALRQRTVFFGGFGAPKETWEWDGNTWTRKQPTQSPDADEGIEMAFDEARARIVLSGGNDLPVWEWDGTGWTQRTPANSIPLFGHVMVYHRGSERMVALEGSLGGTWEYFTTEPASYTSLGSGCVGSAGVPTLAAAAFSRPWAEDDFQLELTQAPPGSMAILLLGISNAQWGGLTLPLDLSPFNMPGCTLYTSIQAQMGTVAAGGVATWSIPIGSAPSGTTFFTQALVFDPSANPRGLTLSNAGTAVVGRR